MTGAHSTGANLLRRAFRVLDQRLGDPAAVAEALLLNEAEVHGYRDKVDTMPLVLRGRLSAALRELEPPAVGLARDLDEHAAQAMKAAALAAYHRLVRDPSDQEGAALFEAWAVTFVEPAIHLAGPIDDPVMRSRLDAGMQAVAAQLRAGVEAAIAAGESFPS
jgi:hypothetical protein